MNLKQTLHSSPPPRPLLSSSQVPASPSSSLSSTVFQASAFNFFLIKIRLQEDS